VNLTFVQPQACALDCNARNASLLSGAQLHAIQNGSIAPKLPTHRREVLSRIDALSKDIESLSTLLAAIQIAEEECEDGGDSSFISHATAAACRPGSDRQVARPAAAEEDRVKLLSPRRAVMAASAPEEVDGLTMPSEPETRCLTPPIRRYASFEDDETPSRAKILYYSCPADVEAVQEESDLLSATPRVEDGDGAAAAAAGEEAEGGRAETVESGSKESRYGRGAAQARQRPSAGATESHAGRTRPVKRANVNLHIAISKVGKLKAEPVSPKVVPRAQEVWSRRPSDLSSGTRLPSKVGEASADRSADAIKERIEKKLNLMFGSSQQVDHKLRRKFKTMQ